MQSNRTNYAIVGASHFDIHILEFVYNRQAIDRFIDNTDRVTEPIVARHDQHR